MNRRVATFCRVLCGVLTLAVGPVAKAAGVELPPTIVQEVSAAKVYLVDQPMKAMPMVRRIEVAGARVRDLQQRAIILGTAFWLRAEIELRSNRLDAARKALESGERIIRVISVPVRLKGDLMISKGNLFMMNNEAAAALSAFQNAYAAFGRVHDPRSQSIALQNIGALYSSAHDDSRAERYYKQAAFLFDGDPLLSLTLHNNRGNVLLVLERYKEAQAEYERAVSLARQLNKPILEARILDNMARNQIEAGNFEQADALLARGFALTQKGEAAGLRRLLDATAAELARQKGDLSKAISLISHVFRGVALDTTTPDFRTPHQYAYQIYRELGDDHLALRHLEALKRLSDDSAKVATTNSAALMAARFDYANQELTIQRLKTEQLRKAAEFQRALFFALGGATLLVIALLSFGLFTIRRSRNQVRAANAVLAHTNAELEKALKVKTEFLATTSHEIRTPLNGILGMTQVMLADAALDGDVRDRLNVVHGAGLTMRALVDDILDVAKMEAGNLTVDPVPMDLRAMLGEVARLWTDQARAKGLDFQLDTGRAPEWIVSDPGRLRQVIFNLLSNAIKFTSTGRIRLLAAGEEQEGGTPRLRIAVTDSGIGIPENKLDEIFESFRQADSSTTRQFGGTGLGLTICRNLAHALGGDIGVTSTVGLGSTFTLDLPLVRAEATVEQAPAAKAPGAAMLVIERNPIARAMLRKLLEAIVSQVEVAAGIEDAHRLLAKHTFSGVLMDRTIFLDFPGNELETLAKLVLLQPEARWTLLVDAGVSAKMSQFLDLGITQVIEKPVVGAVLVEAAVPPSARNVTDMRKDPLVSEAA